MKLIQGEKKMEVVIDSYEFRYDKQGMKEDNNWLNINVKWEDEVLKEEGIVPCLTTWEFANMIQDIELFLKKKQAFYVSDFMEQNLMVKIKPYEDGYAFYISFLFQHHNDPVVLVKQMSEEEIKDMLMDLKAQQKKFPLR